MDNKHSISNALFLNGFPVLFSTLRGTIINYTSSGIFGSYILPLFYMTKYLDDKGKEH